jgi:hypothetical protein
MIVSVINHFAVYDRNTAISVSNNILKTRIQPSLIIKQPLRLINKRIVNPINHNNQHQLHHKHHLRQNGKQQHIVSPLYLAYYDLSRVSQRSIIRSNVRRVVVVFEQDAESKHQPDYQQDTAEYC